MINATNASEGSVSENQEKIENKSLDLGDVIGNFGPWHRRIFITFFMACMILAMSVMTVPFLAPNIDYWCKRPERFLNLSDSKWREISKPKRSETKDLLGKCEMYDLHSVEMSDILKENFTVQNDTKIIACKEWEYDTSLYSSTITGEWNLVCDRDWAISMTQSIYMGGIFLANLLLGHFSDRYGRKRTIRLVLIVQSIAGMAGTFCYSYWQFTISRFFLAFALSGLYVTGYVLIIELVGAKYRTISGTLIQFGWIFGYVALPAVAYIFRNWFHIQLFIDCFSLLTTACWWIFPESPRWLILQGKMDEAEHILKTAAEKNGKSLENFDKKLRKLQDSILELEDKMKQGGKKVNLIDTIRTPNLRKTTFILMYSWSVISFIYFAYSLNTNELGGNAFLSFFISGAVEFPATGLGYLFAKHFGRRVPLALSLFIGGLASVLMIPVPDGLIWLRITMAMIGKLTVTVSFCIVYLYTVELYPTAARSIGLNICSMGARISSLLAPFVKELGHITYSSVPPLVYGALSTLSGALVLLLTETRGRKIPDTIEEAERFGKEKK